MLPVSTLHWLERVVATVGACILSRMTGTLVIRFRFRDGGLRTVDAVREEAVLLSEK